MSESKINTVTESKLDSARRKLVNHGSPYEWDLLPDTLGDPYFLDCLRKEYGLELQELVALKKYYLPNPQSSGLKFDLLIILKESLIILLL